MRSRFIVIVSVLAAGLVSGGCAGGRASLDDLPEREYAGHYTSTRGDSWFHPCAGSSADEAWWVTFTGRSVQQLEELRSSGKLVAGERWFVRWTAAPTTEGQVGPGGPGATALLVREILEVRRADDGDCAG